MDMHANLFAKPVGIGERGKAGIVGGPSPPVGHGLEAAHFGSERNSTWNALSRWTAGGQLLERMQGVQRTQTVVGLRLATLSVLPISDLRTTSIDSSHCKDVHEYDN